MNGHFLPLTSASSISPLGPGARILLRSKAALTPALSRRARGKGRTRAEMKLIVIENPRPLTIEHYNDVANAPLSASLNSGYALAVARNASWETSYLDFTHSPESDTALAEKILAEQADLVLFHWVYSWGEEGRVAAVTRELKARGCARIGAFGLFPTLAVDRLFTFSGLDFILKGEFEETLQDLLKLFSKGASPEAVAGVVLPGRSWRPREVTRDISTLPFPVDVGINGGLKSLNVAASRGCFGCCSFCFIPTFYGSLGRRVRSVASLEAELDARLAGRDLSHVYFIDPTFLGPASADRKRAAEIGSVLKARGMSFGFETRVDTVDGDLMLSLAKDGATEVFLGVESGCDAALKRMNKKVGTRAIVEAVRKVRGAGIDLHAGFIMFEPDSTLDELKENYRFLEELALLSDADRTINLLYHSQIVLYGSRSWERFQRESRLVHDERLPFEATFTFKDPQVDRVCSAMKRLSTWYFLRPRQTSGDGDGTRSALDEINGLLKESFLTLVSSVASMTVKEFEALQERLLEELNRVV